MAAGERHLFVIVVAVMMFVIGPVLLLTPFIAWRYRWSKKDRRYEPKWDFSWVLEFLIWVPPFLIVVGLSVVLWPRTRQLDPYAPITSPLPPLEVQAVGLDWKWLFIYPDRGIATLNELAIPAGRPVHISLTSGTVMQSMLVPKLAGQIYAMAGMTTQLNLAADHPGTYVGRNTQFNGAGFQDQRFSVVSMTPEAYERWATRVKAVGRPLDAAAVDRLFARSSEPVPVLYATLPPALFQQILRRSQAASMPGAGTNR